MKKQLSVSLCLMLAAFLAQAAEKTVSYTPAAMERSAPAPDNTNINKRDRNEQTLTPLDQSNSKADINITQAIRKSIMKHRLSTDAKNIKIITRTGNVTLRGPVKNNAELEQIGSLVKEIHGIKTVENQLEVK